MEDTWQESDLQKRSVIALEQLRPFQNRADTWPLVEHKHHSEYKAPQLGMCCKLCDQTVYFTEDTKGNPYRYSTEEIRALITAHIRRQHEEVNDEGI